MVGFKAKARASAYFAKLGWIRMCVLWVGCMCVRSGYGWGSWCVLEGWECIGRRGKRNYTIISYLLH